MIKIHNFPRGARGLRVMWLCEEMGLPYETHAVKFPPSKAYLALNPLGSVPFLEDEGGIAINESVAMMLYVAERYGPTPFLPPKADASFARVLQMTVFSEATIGGAMNTLMMAHFGAPEADKRNWSVRGVEGRVERAIGYVESMFGEKAFIAGDAPTIADMCIVTALGIWQGALGKSLSPKLVVYRDMLAARPAYLRAHQRCGGQS